LKYVSVRDKRLAGPSGDDAGTFLEPCHDELISASPGQFPWRTAVALAERLGTPLVD
jgi:hypothetical protein